MNKRNQSPTCKLIAEVEKIKHKIANHYIFYLGQIYNHGRMGFKVNQWVLKYVNMDQTLK